jgi:hypothetical protein
MSKFCPHCGCEYGKEGCHDENAVICTKTGIPIVKERGTTVPAWQDSGLKEGWNIGLMILLCILAFLCPLFGWIFGGCNMNKEKYTEGRRNQAFALIIIASISFAMFIGLNMAATGA